MLVPDTSVCRKRGRVIANNVDATIFFLLLCQVLVLHSRDCVAGGVIYWPRGSNLVVGSVFSTRDYAKVTWRLRLVSLFGNLCKDARRICRDSIVTFFIFALPFPFLLTSLPSPSSSLLLSVAIRNNYFIIQTDTSK